LDFATFPELQKVLSELNSDIMMEEKVNEHKLSPNKTELVCVAEARDDIIKELDDMKQCIVRVQTILNNISTKLQSTVAKTVATMVEEHLKKGHAEESDDVVF
jgi:Lon protease-like protein